MINQDLSKTISNVYEDEDKTLYLEVDNIENLDEGDIVWIIETMSRKIIFKTMYFVSDSGEHILRDVNNKARFWNGREVLDSGYTYQLAVECKKISETTLTVSKSEETVLPTTKEDLLDQLVEYDDDIEELLLAIESFKDTRIGYKKLVDNWGIEAKNLDLKKVLEEILPQTLEFGDMIISNMNKHLLDAEAALNLSEKDANLAWHIFYEANKKLVALRALAREFK